MTRFLKRNQHSIYLGLSENVQTLLACEANAYEKIINDISGSRCQKWFAKAI